MPETTNDSRVAPVFQLLAEDIQALGVRTVFGLMSDDTAVFAVTLDGLGVKFVGARHENNAIAMAEGYAYATGELGVAVIGRGPATANGLHAAVAASRMGSRVLVASSRPSGSASAPRWWWPRAPACPHRAGGRRRRLPHDDERARVGEPGRHPPDHRADERLRRRGRAALPGPAQAPHRQGGVSGRGVRSGGGGLRISGAHDPQPGRPARAWTGTGQARR